MSKALYKVTVFFLFLTAACGLLQSIIGFEMGSEIYTVDSFAAWFTWEAIIGIVAPILLLKYFYFRQYRVVFYAAAVALTASLVYMLVFCNFLITKQIVSYYKPIVLIYLCAAIIYSICLMFLGSRKNFWLNIAGFIGLIIGLALLSTVIWSTTMPHNISGRITQWASLAAVINPVMFIMHFKTEIRLLKTDTSDIPIQDHVDRFGLIKLIACLITIPLGLLIIYQCAMQVYWGKRNFENTKALARLFEARVFVNSKGDTLRYRLLKPLNYNPEKLYPLVVSLPFGGQPGTDTIRQIEGAVAAVALSADSNRRKYPAFILVPNCPAGSGWGGIPNYPSADTLVYKVITSLDTLFSIDKKRRYVTGISRGGYGTWHFICTRPDLFAAAIPISGGEDPKLASRIVNVSVWAFHGAKDQNVPVTGSRDMIAGMKRAGQKPKYTEYPKYGHNLWHQVSITPGLWNWLFAQKRN